MTDVDELAAWLDSAGVTEWQQIIKVSEEAGEVAKAYLGYIGTARKGVCATRRDVLDELADVAIAAMVAMKRMGYVPDRVVAQRITEVRDRIKDGEEPT